MKRSLYLVSGLLCFLIACGGKSQSTSDGGTDMGDVDSTLCSGAGCVGGACIKDSDCTEGNSAMTAVCWGTTLLNNTKFVTTPGGYCSRECQADTDCGTAKCVNLPSSGKKYCMAKCSSATRCRKPGYSCAFDGDTGGICFPSANFDCNPSLGDGTCEYGDDKYLGGCVRVAYESDKGGVCHLQCQVGFQTCPPDDRAGGNPPQLCAYVDSTLDAQGNPTSTGDKFKGNLCFQQSSAPVQPGMACKYWTDCTDGYECDRYNVTEANRVCRQLCAQGGTPTAPAGLFMPSGAMPAGSTCTATTEGCANSLRGNVQIMGSSGLCQPKM